MYDHTFYKQVQISRSDIRPHIKWAVSLVILHMITSIFLRALCGYIWVNILTLSPRGGKVSWFETRPLYLRKCTIVMLWQSLHGLQEIQLSCVHNTCWTLALDEHVPWLFQCLPRQEWTWRSLWWHIATVACHPARYYWLQHVLEARMPQCFMWVLSVIMTIWKECSVSMDMR